MRSSNQPHNLLQSVQKLLSKYVLVSNIGWGITGLFMGYLVRSLTTPVAWIELFAVLIAKYIFDKAVIEPVMGAEIKATRRTLKHVVGSWAARNPTEAAYYRHYHQRHVGKPTACLECEPQA